MADGVSVKLKGTKAVTANIKKYSLKKKSAALNACKAVGYDIEADAKRGVPVMHGRLQRSITTNWTGSTVNHSAVEGVTKPTPSPGEYTVKVGTNIKYAHMQEFGSWGEAPKPGKGEYPPKRDHEPTPRPEGGFLYLTKAYVRNKGKVKPRIAKVLK